MDAKITSPKLYPTKQSSIDRLKEQGPALLDAELLKSAEQFKPKQSILDRMNEIALEILDAETLQIKKCSSAATLTVIADQRPAYAEAYGDDGNIELVCRGVTFVFPAHLATQTASGIAKLVSEQKKMVPRPHRMRVYPDAEPYILDRVINFWANLRLDVGPQKTITSPYATSSMTMSEYDATNTMTTPKVLFKIYALAARPMLDDAALKEAALAEIRNRVVDTEVPDTEVLDCAFAVYAAAGDNPSEDFKVVRRIFATSIVQRAADTIFNAEAWAMQRQLVSQYRDATGDTIRGQSYYLGPYTDLVYKRGGAEKAENAENAGKAEKGN